MSQPSGLPHPRQRRQIHLVTVFLAIVLAATVLTSLTDTISGFRSARKSIAATTFQLNYERASTMSATVNEIIIAMQNGLRTAAASVSTLRPDDPELQRRLELVLGSSGYFNSLSLCDADGTVRSIAPASLGLAGKRLNSAAIETALATRQPTISNPYMSVTNRMIVLMTWPVTDRAGRYLGFVGGTIYLQEPNVLNKILDPRPIDDSGTYAYIVDRDGKLLFHPDKSRLGENVSVNPVVKQLMKGASGSDSVINTRGVSFLAGYAAVPVNGWGIVVQSPRTGMDKETMALVRRQLIASLPFILLLLGAAAWIALTIARPFAALSKTAQRIVLGERVTDLPFDSHWNYEAHQLTKSMMLAVKGLQQYADALSLEAKTDALTGLSNRRTMEAELNRWRREGIPFTVIELDIDHFKAINDTCGHQTGDEVLVLLAGVMVEEAGQTGVCCRFGGEEFVILVPGVQPDGPLGIAERIRVRMAETIGPTGKPVTVSVGISDNSGSSADPELLLRQADEALYAAKRGGRNRTVVYTADSAD